MTSQRLQDTSPDDVSTALREAEHAALRLSRGLPTEAQWDDLAALAQGALGVCESLEGADLSALYDADGEALQLAARILDDYATHAPFVSAEVARQRNLWTATAFGACGNGPSATVALRRAFPTLRPRTPAHAAFLLACAPSTVPGARAHLSRIAGATLAADALQAFLTSGDEALIAPARDAWRALFENASPQDSALLHPARIALEHAFALGTARALRQHSQLSANEWARLVEARPVLLPPQHRALDCGLLSRAENAVVSLKPSTGKTLLGEMCVLEALRGDGLAVFLAPYVALGRQTASALREHLPSSVRVHIWLGGHEASGDDLSAGRHVAVATPERLDALLRARPEVRRLLRVVVCDEAHLVADGGRGARLEGLLTRLRLMQADNALSERGPRLVLLSAAAGQARELCDWMNAPDELRIRDAWTPTARRLAIWNADGQLAWHDAATGEPVGATKLLWPHPLRATESWPQMQKLEPLARENVAHLAARLHEQHGGAILCVCATRAGARQLALSLSRAFGRGAEPKGARANAIALIDERFAWLQPLKACLQVGVAWHNGTLPHEVRALIEDAVREGELGAVASTTTLAEGVDLPFRWTILADWLHWNGDNERRELAPMSRALWRNIAGRCGRAGIYTEGDTLAFDNPLGPLQFTDADARAGYHASLFLSRDEASPRSALEELSPDVREAWAAQLLPAVLENSRETQLPQRFARATYAAHLGDVERLEAASRQLCDELTRDGFATRDENGALQLTPLGRAANLTGMSPASCRVALNALSQLRAPRSLFDDIDDPRDKNDTPAARAAREVSALLLATRDAPACPSSVRRLGASRSRLPLRPAELPHVLTGWLEGFAPEEVFAKLSKGARHSDEVEADAPPQFDVFADWMRATVESWVPWLCRSAAVLEPFAKPQELPAWPWEQWARCCEVGADSVWAIEALRRSVPGGRRALSLLGRFWPASWPSDFDVLGSSAMRAGGYEEFEVVVRAALKAAGGRYSPDGRGVLQARDWLWQANT